MVYFEFAFEGTSPAYRKQNSKANQEILDSNLEHLNDQCKRLWGAFCEGRRMTVLQIMNELGIGDPRARIRDLRKFGLPVADKKLEGRFKEYFKETKNGNFPQNKSN